MSRVTRIFIAAAVAASFAGSASHAASQGEKVYDRTCIVCHGDGLSGAPRLGNKSEWATRAARGKEALFESVKNGKGLMPPRGGNSKFTDEDLRAAIEYMLAQLR
jgi:cytochrome c5